MPYCFPGMKDNGDGQSQTKDVKALSGGERSFTTLSLLLAIGESLETPFRVMDEFDVFLDPVARKIALTTLVSSALFEFINLGHIVSFVFSLNVFVCQ